MSVIFQDGRYLMVDGDQVTGVLNEREARRSGQPIANDPNPPKPQTIGNYSVYDPKGGTEDGASYVTAMPTRGQVSPITTPKEAEYYQKRDPNGKVVSGPNGEQLFQYSGAPLQAVATTGGDFLSNSPTGVMLLGAGAGALIGGLALTPAAQASEWASLDPEALLPNMTVGEPMWPGAAPNVMTSTGVNAGVSAAEVAAAGGAGAGLLNSTPAPAGTTTVPASGTTAQQVGTKAAVGAVTHPDDPLKGALTGALGAVAGGLTPALADSIANGTELPADVSKAIATGLASGGVAGVTGGNVGLSAALGAGDTVAAGALNDAGIDPLTGRAIVAAGNAAVTRGNPLTAAAGSAGSGLLNSAINDATTPAPSEPAPNNDASGENAGVTTAEPDDTQAALNLGGENAGVVGTGETTPSAIATGDTVTVTPAQQAAQWSTGIVNVGSPAPAATTTTAPAVTTPVAAPGIGFAPVAPGVSPTGAPLLRPDGTPVYNQQGLLNLPNVVRP